MCWRASNREVKLFSVARKNMKLTEEQLWSRFKEFYTEFPTIGLSVDLSRTHLDAAYGEKMQPALQKAFAAMDDLERGAVANSDEQRMVGHYWLRNASLAPSAEIRRDIEQTISAIKGFAQQVHSGEVTGENGAFKKLLVIGIGGSALGPQFVAHALGQPCKDKMQPFFFDNTDPDGMDKVLAQIGSDLGKTLAIVISKSGGTKETRNGMLEAQRAYEAARLAFS